MSRKSIKIKEKKPIKIGTYKTTITYECPVRGLVTQEVEVKQYASPHQPESFLDKFNAFQRSLEDELKDIECT